MRGVSDDTPTTLAELANRHPDELALADDHQQVTWAELDALTHRIGNG